MAVRVTHTNNSDGHDGTFVYRSTSPMDPQALPAPIADEPPVALGAVFEYIDNDSLGDGIYYYRVQDYEGGQASTVSDQVSVLVGDDFSTAQHGDYIGGGILAGTITYGDGRQFYIVFAKQSGELDSGSGDTRWKTSQTSTAGTTDPDDGEANTSAMQAAGIADHPAAQHCRNYSADGNSDWYLPAENELALEANLRGHPEFSTDTTLFRWTSNEESAAHAYRRRLSDGAEGFNSKVDTTQLVRPIRRVPA